VKKKYLNHEETVPHLCTVLVVKDLAEERAFPCVKETCSLHKKDGYLVREKPANGKGNEPKKEERTWRFYLIGTKTRRQKTGRERS
jgi:hypothetical protein